MKKKIIIIVSIILLLMLIISLIALYEIQPILFFHPWHDEISYSQLKMEEEFEEIIIDNNGKKLYGWFKNNIQNEKAPLVIMFGGNVQNSSNICVRYLNEDIYKYFDDYNFMIVDYPGYGLSEGKTSDKTMFEAALKVYDYASSLDKVDKEKIVVIGYSIGTGVATYVASQRDVNGLILVAPYDEALSLYNKYINVFYGPIKLLQRYKFKSIEYAGDVKTSPLIITSFDDEVIDYEFSLNLANYFNDVYKTIILNENIKHNDYFNSEEVLDSIYNYLQERK